MSIFYPFLSLLWGSVNGLRRLLYRARLLRQTRLGAGWVVSVGNLEVGGTGKTPVTAMIAQDAIAQGKSVAILSRGYGGTAESGTFVIRPGASDQDGGERVPAAIAGDEPALLHLRVPEAWIGVGSNRVRAYAALVKEKGSEFDLVILDDGLQHLRVCRDVDVVLITSRPWWKTLRREFFAPRGALVVQTKGERELGAKVRVAFETEFSRTPADGPTWLVAGVASPNEVKAGLERLGYPVERLIAKGDHAHYPEVEMENLNRFAAASKANLVLTGKDYVKWSGNPQVIWIEPRAKVVEGYETWRERLFKN